ncbi:amino acid adenylation domain-containing protein [Methylocystis sp. WRRC1]|uniref:Pls/PosA family non-ribosomal peptide synthetase n=1 Tax=Methylocystis sp. WRRC1 TaxID=1732014 RepID=UPI001D14721C|nr:Pls/PosA family non-ribosomal peptide synthetase [Methylocystis sp. WRRC1]MCC3246978.1 amino acid adenylation domain-containing protein [Methylocystis sp. WRRC1]
MKDNRSDLAPMSAVETRDPQPGRPADAATPLAALRGPHAPHLQRDELLCEIFAATVAATPNALCMTTLERRFTYAEVDARATAIARGLLAHGAGPGDVIGLWMARGPELLIAQLAIAKTGAAWLPFDADAPADRIAICLKDAESRLLVTSAAFAPKAAPSVEAKTLVDEEIALPGDDPIPTARELGATPDHPAYLIYTSGSTGTPKGIVVSGRNICHYLRSANEIYGVTQLDVVFQGASAAFDLSMEEIWIPYLVGATLFVATPQIIGETEALPDLLEEAGVTVLDTVPTLLGVMPRDVKTLRVIILGGEACPPAIAERWSRPGRVIFNSYGPTEATVVATVAQVWPNEPVTIGKPIPNYTCYVVNDAMELLPPGVEGELLIGGPGVANGYLKRDELTAEKFIANPFLSDGGDPILYRSGDAVLLDEKGDIVFRGRIDDQIKIRGFRVELGEIESVLGHQRNIRQAAVALRNETGVDELVAFVVTNSELPDPRELRGNLREVLPSYMVPSRFEVVEALPRLSSGKVDRKALKQITLTQPAPSNEEQEEPRDETEAALLAAAKRVLPPGAIPFDADFFTELGGHSLLAARFVSVVRETPRLASITLQDLYALRTLRALAGQLEGKTHAQARSRDLSFKPTPLLRRFLCGLAQAAALPFILAIVTAQWLGVFVSYQLITTPDATLLDELVALLGVYMCVNVATLLVSIGGKWLVIGRTKPGRYPLWGVYYYRWWLSQRLIGLTHAKWFQVSPLMRLYLSALGAKIGEDALISELDMGAIDLVSIGAGASLGSKLKLSNARVEGDELVIGTIDIGADAYIGTSCVIENDVVIGDGAALEDLTSVPAGARIGAHEIWNGSPARHSGMVDESALDAPARAEPGRRLVMTFLFTLLVLAIPPLGLLPIFPAFWAFDKLESMLQLTESQQTLYLALIPVFAWPTAFVLVLVTVAFIVAFRWIVLPRVSEGRYSVWSWFYLRKWAVALATEVTLETLSSLFATLYMRTWYRLMGAKIGKDSEISTNLSGRYDIVDIGEKCFIADEVVLGDEDVRRGWMYLRHVKTGDRVFIGNDAVVPPGAEIPANALIGIKSKPPENREMSEGDTWFGSPPIKLPVRQTFDAGGASWTYQPPLWKKALRAVYEAVNVSLPTMLFMTFGTWAVESFGQKLVDGEYGAVAALFILDSVLISIGMTLAVVAVKWVTMGRYEPQVKPMWSFWAMRTEACAVLYWGLAGKVLLEHLRGTPFLPWMLRLFGAKFGRGVFMDMTDITEFDCVKVGDYCALNMVAALQTHLYEDRVMKVGRVELGKGVTVGAGSTVLYDTHIGDYARLGPLTVVMKGESIPAHSEWIGAPAEPSA